MTVNVIAAPIAFALGYYFVPPLTDKLLIYKLKEIDASWDKSLHEYETHVKFTKRKPSLNGERCERSMAQWGKRQIALVNAKKLSFEQVLALRVVGIVPTPTGEQDPAMSLPTDREVAQKYCLPCTLGTRLLCGIALLAVAAALLACSTSLAMLASAIAAGCIVECIFLCDMRARIIPYQLCLAFALCAVAFSYVAAGLEGLATSALLGLGMYLALQLVNRVMSYLSGSPAIGDGDMHFIPLICVFSGLAGTFYGFAGASVVMAFLALFTVLVKGGNAKSYVPYAPGLSCWFAIGLITQAAWA